MTEIVNTETDLPKTSNELTDIEEAVNIEQILNYFKHVVKNKLPLSPAQWLSGAQRLNVLLDDFDQETVIPAQMGFAREVETGIHAGKSVAESRARALASPANEAKIRAEARKERIEEAVRIAKKRTEMRDF